MYSEFYSLTYEGFWELGVCSGLSKHLELKEKTSLLKISLRANSADSRFREQGSSQHDTRQAKAAERVQLRAVCSPAH